MEHIGISTNLPSAEEVVLEYLISRFIYILYVDGIPVSMFWKRQPLRNGCSISFVYTPNTERGKGYASACVAMCTELFLKEYSFVTLFVVRQQDSNKNLYTSIGYQLVGKSARLRACTE
jgi:predicted GNAT family acetyltransferase